MIAVRPLLVLAFVAALLGAPSAASAAPNAIVPLPTTPATGTTATTFTLTATFEGRFGATALTVDVAGRSVPMSLVLGTAALGTWSASTTLPAGTWHPTFSAAVAQGNVPSATGAPIVVVTLSPPPSPTLTAAPDATAGGPVGDVGGPSTRQRTTQPTTGASVSTAPAAPAEAGAPATPGGGGKLNPAASPQTGATPAGATPAGGEAAGQTPGEATAGGPPPSEGAQPAAAPRATAAGSPATASALSAPAETVSPVPAADQHAAFDPREPGGALLIGGVAALAAVALIGTSLLLGARRRRDSPAAVTSGKRGGGNPPEAEAVSATLRARSVRRARTRLDEDPIVAALGIEDDVSARRARIRLARTKPDGTEPPPPT